MRPLTTIFVALFVGAVVTATGSAEASNPIKTLNPGASAKEDANPDPLGSDAVQLAKDEGITTSEEIAALERQPLVGELQSAMQSKGPANYGGLYIDYVPDYRITILARPDGAPEVLQAVSTLGFYDLAKFITVRETDFTEDALQHAETQVQDAAGSSLSTVDFDIRTGQVLATGTTAEDVSRIQSRIDLLQEPLSAAGVVITQGQFQNTDAYGGQHADSTTDICTTGFSVWSTNGFGSGVADAAHCANSFVNIAGNAAVFMAGKWGDNQDVQWFDTPYDADLNKVKDSDSGSTRAITSRTDRSEMIVGGGVCHYGRTTSGCGIILSKSYNPGPLDSHTYNSTFIRVTNDAVGNGDSGGPWYIVNSAFGTTKGHTSNGDPVFMAQNYMSALDLIVKVN